MQKISCEVCGSGDLVKQDGVYVCQYCGMKYSPDEVKKMMIEGTVEVQGTVKVDNSAFIEKSLANARRAKLKEDWEEVEKYYNMVEQHDPQNIEAIFYSAYGKAKNALVSSDIYKRQAAFKVLQNCVSIIDDNFDYNRESDLKIVEQISQDIINMACSSYVYNQRTNGYGVITTDASETLTLFNNLNLVFVDSLNNIAKGFTNDSLKIKLYKMAVLHLEFVLKKGSLKNAKGVINILNEYKQKIHSLDPTYNDTTSYELAVEKIKEKMGSIFKVCLMVASVIPVLGTIYGLIALLGKKNYPNISVKFIGKIIGINLVATGILALILGLTL